MTYAAPLDDIRAFLGSIPADEYEQRRRIRDCRSLASSMVHKTGGANARSLLWMACDAATSFYLSTHDTETLAKVANLCRDLIRLADQANELEDSDGLA